MLRVLCVLVLVLGLAAEASAQVAGACQPVTTPSAVVFGRSLITFQSADHNAVDPAGALKVADYFGEVRIKGDTNLVTNFTIPKNSVTPVTGTGIPAGCLQTLLPAMAPLLPSAVYTLTFYARNPQQTPSANPMAADFFLSQASVPAGPAALKLVTP